jgi:hypothetical protein
MSEVVSICLSQFHDDSTAFEMLLGYADGKEIGHLITRPNAIRIADEFMWEFGSSRVMALEAEIEKLTDALRSCAAVLPKYAMKGDTASDDEALHSVIEQVHEALTGEVRQ